MVINTIIAIFIISMYMVLAHYLSYFLMKKRILQKKKWDLNICCGKTDSGGINVDIAKYKNLPRFKLVNDIYNLPFKNGEFDTVLSSHTIEHIDDPKRFYSELNRVGKKITLVVPPLYDLGAVFNIFEHKWIFLTFKKEHHSLPRFIKLPFANAFQNKFGQNIKG